MGRLGRAHGTDRERGGMSRCPTCNTPRWTNEDLYSGLDPGVRQYVRILREGGVETFESCQGGPDPARPDTGHAYPEPTVRFHGNSNAGWHALSVAHDHRLPVQSLARIWPI